MNEGLRDNGGVDKTVLCVIDRSGGDHSLLESIDLNAISPFRTEDLS